MPDRFLQPPAAPKDVLDRAERLGTLNQVDRRAQYSSLQHAKPEALLEAVNVQGNHIRGVQKDLGQLQHAMMNLRLRNALVVAVATALLTRAPEIAGGIAGWISRIWAH